MRLTLLGPTCFLKKSYEWMDNKILVRKKSFLQKENYARRLIVLFIKWCVATVASFQDSTDFELQYMFSLVWFDN